MKKILLLLIMPIIFSCGNNSKQRVDNTETSSNNINKCLVGVDWCQPNCSNPTMAWKFSSDGTFNYSTTMFGGMSAWGNWEEVQNNQIEISYTKTTTGNLLPNQILSMPDCNSLKVGKTTYRK